MTILSLIFDINFGPQSCWPSMFAAFLFNMYFYLSQCTMRPTSWVWDDHFGANLKFHRNIWEDGL